MAVISTVPGYGPDAREFGVGVNLSERYPSDPVWLNDLVGSGGAEQVADEDVPAAPVSAQEQAANSPEPVRRVPAGTKMIRRPEVTQ